MDLSYKFVDADGEEVAPCKIDEEIQNELGLPINPKRFNTHYIMVVLMGLNTLMQFEGCEVSEDNLDAATESLSCCVTEAQVALAKKYLCGKYTFHAWS